MINESSLRGFKKTIWEFYEQSGRHELPWRHPDTHGKFDPYMIMVSEVMLQQTQVLRVIPKYHEFMDNYPTLQALAKAPQGSVLKTWSGLGYNRRAKYLRLAAVDVVEKFEEHLPSSYSDLITLPGIGSNTAGAILAYAYNQPIVFIETNIRSVFIHHFFEHQSNISDKKILELVAQTLDTTNPREWYWALMDYGSHLKRIHKNPSSRAANYIKQAKFAGSKRQLRGLVLRLLKEKTYSDALLKETIADERLEIVLADLVKEQLILRSGDSYSL